MTQDQSLNGHNSDMSEDKADAVPESIRYAPTDKGLVPIVKVVAMTHGNTREIVEYGTKGQFLRSTMHKK